MSLWLVKTLFLCVVVMTSPSGPTFDTNERQAERARLVVAVNRDVARNREVLGRPRLSPSVEDALRTVPRHLFVPEQHRALAYNNNALPIGQGQTISQPTIVALMTDLLALAPGDTVLEVGTGSGYQAAVLATVLPTGHVHTIEIIPELARAAGKMLDELGYANVTVHTGDGYRGLPGHAPFAGVMVTAAAKRIPQDLIDQLRPGGRLVMPLGAQTETQWLTVLEKLEDGETQRRTVLPVRFVPLTGEVQRRP